MAYRPLSRCAIGAAALAALAGCTPPPPGPSVMALPGPGKDLPAFQKDDTACHQYAAQQAGVTVPPPPPAPYKAADGTIVTPKPPPPPTHSQIEATQRLAEISYSQCMVAHGDTLRPATVATPYTPYYPYPAYAYPVQYGPEYAYPYPYMYGGFYDTVGWGGAWDAGWGWHGPDFYRGPIGGPGGPGGVPRGGGPRR